MLTGTGKKEQKHVRTQLFPEVLTTCSRNTDVTMENSIAGNLEEKYF